MTPALVQLALLAADGGEEGGNPLLKVSPGLWIWTLIIFLLLYLVLRKWGFGKMIEKLDARDEAIRGAIDDAAKQRAEAETLLAEQRALLEQSRKDAAAATAAAQEQAAAERRRIVAEAREEYEKIVARGRSQIEQETSAALAKVRGAAADLALEAAGKLVGRTLDEPAQRALAQKFIDEIERKN